MYLFTALLEGFFAGGKGGDLGIERLAFDGVFLALFLEGGEFLGEFRALGVEGDDCGIELGFFGAEGVLVLLEFFSRGP